MVEDGGADRPNYEEYMAIAAAREVLPGEKVFMGMGFPCLVATMAKLAYHFSVEIYSEYGMFDWRPQDVDAVPRAPSIGDTLLTDGSAMIGDMGDVLGWALMGGNMDCVILTGAQVDKYGNVNTVVIGDYNNPIRKLNGAGGNTDAACVGKRAIVAVPHTSRRVIERVDFITSPGYIHGPGARERAGLNPQGPNAVVTTMGVFRFDTPDGGRTGSCEMYLDTIYPGLTVTDVKANTPWDIKISPNLKVMEPVTLEERILLWRLDPTHAHLKGRG